MKQLFTNQTATDTTKNNAFVTTGAGVYTLHAFGTFDTAVMNVYLSLNGTSDGKLLSTGIFTAADMANIEVAAETNIWAEVASVGAGTDISLNMVGPAI
jgi:hypothetical protein